MLVDSTTARSAFTEQEKLAIHEQLERLLSNPFFSHSRRFPAFLRFVVERTLEGNTDQLKERTLGVEIFGKRADYDTGSDPIVRVTAAEIRKRIAQYYMAPEHEGELRLSLPPGSYVPHFRWPEPVRQTSPETEIAHAAQPEHPFAESSVAQELPIVLELPRLRARFWKPRRTLSAIVAAVLLLCALAGMAVWRNSRQSALSVFWEPVLNAAEPVLICIADQSQYKQITLRDADDPSREVVLNDRLTAVIIDDISPVVKLAGVLESNKKKYTLRGEQNTTLMDLRTGSTIFVGAYSNAWTLRLLKPLRFHFQNNANMTRFSIIDSASNQPTPWMVDRTQQMATNNYRDYAIVARFTDSNTGRLAIIAAGVGRGGTIAAGEFLIDAASLERLNEACRKSGRKNVEAVLSTEIIDGESGTPRIEAIHTW